MEKTIKIYNEAYHDDVFSIPAVDTDDSGTKSVVRFIDIPFFKYFYQHFMF